MLRFLQRESPYAMREFFANIIPNLINTMKNEQNAPSSLPIASNFLPITLTSQSSLDRIVEYGPSMTQGVVDFFSSSPLCFFSGARLLFPLISPPNQLALLSDDLVTFSVSRLAVLSSCKFVSLLLTFPSLI